MTAHERQPSSRRRLWLVLAAGTLIVLTAIAFSLWPSAEERRLLGKWYGVYPDPSGTTAVFRFSVGGRCRVAMWDGSVAQLDWSASDGRIQYFEHRSGAMGWRQLWERFAVRLSREAVDTAYIEYRADGTVRITADEGGGVTLFRDRSAAKEYAEHLKEEAGENE